MNTLKKEWAALLSTLLNSYAQVFFSQNRWLGGILLTVSLLHPASGLAGMVAVLAVALFARLLQYDRVQVENGAYTFNALLTGLGMGYLFELGWQFWWVNVLAALLSFFATLWCANVLGSRGLPYLSLPFLAATWTVLLGKAHFAGLAFAQTTDWEKTADAPFLFSVANQLIDHLPFANALHLYLRSLGAVFFQFSDLAGLLIAIGLFLHSRIAWLASFVGFGIGYFFYQRMEGDFSTLVYTYVGFNFILTAVAVSAFFMVPSRWSFGVLLVLMPLTALLLAALHSLFAVLQLPLYSLPFNIAVLFFLTAMYLRQKAGGLNMVAVQHFSPEKNHYYFFNDRERFRYDTFVHIALPFMGEWRVSQGYDGGVTHRGEWAQALDFDITDAEGKTYRAPGYQNPDYYCYDLPVVAPAAGRVEVVLDHVPDNAVGQVNVQQNWGNTIVIKHAENLYSKLSHLRAGTILVKKGDVVFQGQVLARLGSSGRSPEPHLHFQLQTTPYIGSKTLAFPISHFLVQKSGGGHTFKAFSVPQVGEIVSNVAISQLLVEAFGFTPGKKFSVTGKRGGETISETWEAYVTPGNVSYLWCPERRSTLWFVNNGTLFYCTGYDGDNRSLLYLFYLGAYKVLLGYYPNLSLSDTLPLNGQTHFLLKNLHDLVAPFFHFLRIHYQFRFSGADNRHEPSLISFESECRTDFLKRPRQTHRFSFEVAANRLFFKTDFDHKPTEILCALQQY